MTTLPIRIIALLALLVGLALGYQAWAKHQQALGYQTARADYAKQAKAADDAREAIAAPIVEKQEAAQVQIRTVTKTLIEKVKVYVPSNSCPLPAGYGRLHDAAATNVKIPDTATGLDDSTIPAQDAIAITIENYGIANSNAARLTGLQEWVRSQEALTTP